VSLRYHLTNGSKNILDIYGKMNGTFSMEDISNSATSEDSEEIDLVSNGEVYFQVFNVKIAGTMDFKNYLAAEDAIDSNLEGDAYAAKVAEAVNKYAKLNLVFTDSEEKIATVLAFPRNDGSTKIKLKLAFSSEDKSPVDLETYIQTGFDSLVDNYFSFLDELEDSYGK
ncbi:MAG TPA: hypothetical protein VHO90_19060, partial [Bacteroidales bacterium]|nr:hypothetical protein [Bacteroidales bacterium]